MSPVKRLTLTVLLTLLAGCGGTRVSKPLTESLTEATVTMTMEWKRGVGTMRPFLAPALAGDSLCTVSASGLIFIVEAVSGELVYAPSTMPNQSYDYYSAGTGCNGSVVVAVTEAGTLHVYDVLSGLLWEKALNTRVFGMPVIADGKLFVAGLDGRLLAYTEKYGRELWRLVSPLDNPIRTPLDSTVMLTDDTLYLGLDDGAIVALNPQDGRVRWKNIVTRPRGNNAIIDILDVTTPVVGAAAVCAAAHLNGVACFDRDSGKRLWYQDLPSSTRAAFDASGRTLFVTDNDGVLYAFDAATGEQLWQYETERDLSAPLALADVVLVGDGEGMVYAFSADSGAPAAVLDIGADEIIHLLRLSDDAAAVLSLDGQLARVKIAP